MPFKRIPDVIDLDTSPAPDTRAELAQRLSSVLDKVEKVSIRRYKGAGKPKPVGLPLLVQFDSATEDRDTLAGEVADEAIRIALEEAGDRRVRFLFVALAEALPKEQPGELFAFDAWINSDDERPATKDSEYVAMLRTAREHMTGVSTEHVNLLKQTNGLVAMVTATLAKLSESGGEAWKASVMVAEMQHARDIEAGRIVADAEKTYSRHRMYTNIIGKVAPIAESLLDVVAGRANDSDAPTPSEVDKVFGETAPDLRDLMLAYLRAKPEDKKPIGKKLHEAWQAAGQDVQSKAMIAAHEKLGPERARRVVTWIAATFKDVA